MPTRLVAPLLAALAVLLVAGLALLVTNHVTDPIDVALIRAVRDPALVAPLAWLRQLTELGSTIAMTILAIVLLLAELLARRPRTGIAAAATIGLAALVNELTKGLIERTRPDVIQPIVTEHGFSFPSGHAGLSTVGYGIAALLVARSGAPWGVKVAAVVAAGCLVALIGISRVYLGAHFPSDVAAGWLAGGAVVLLFAWLSPGSRAPAYAPAAEDRAEPRSDLPGTG
ncbi:MAG: phosphatase PAP2 family protein [Chloroflexota bacterium]|nr:phosphatase PAP2 family protein [Chloroflexota bacterium]